MSRLRTWLPALVAGAAALTAGSARAQTQTPGCMAASARRTWRWGRIRRTTRRAGTIMNFPPSDTMPLQPFVDYQVAFFGPLGIAADMTGDRFDFSASCPRD